MNYEQLEKDVWNSPVLSDPKNPKHSRFKLMEILPEHCKIEGPVYEFGVRAGHSIRKLNQLFGPITGFDSFEGIPEDWVVNNKQTQPAGLGKMEPPEVGPDVKLVVGWFKDTLGPWFETHKEPIKLAHIDCDIYTGTVEILDTIKPYIVPGTVLLFDELMGFERSRYTNWREYEWKALCESGIAVKALARTDHEAAAVVVV